MNEVIENIVTDLQNSLKELDEQVLESYEKWIINRANEYKAFVKVMKEDYCAGLTIANIMKNVSIFAVERLGTM